MRITYRGILALALGSLITSGSALLSPRVVHESRSPVPGWVPIRRAEPDALLPLRLGLAQSNLDKLDDFLLDVSHPASPNYAKHWSAAKVAETFRASTDTVDTVRTWLHDSGIDAPRVKLSPSGVWLSADVTIAEAERLLGTEYYVYQRDDGDERVACSDKYHLPEHVSNHVELVTPTFNFDRAVGRRSPSRRSIPKGSLRLGKAAVVNQEDLQGLGDLSSCDSLITPFCIQALYNFYYEPVAPKDNALGIAEFMPDAYVGSDLDDFWGNFTSDMKGVRPNFHSAQGGTLQPDLYENQESDLDFAYSMFFVGPKQPVELYETGDLPQSPGGNTSFNALLDALDGSYCTYEGGDDYTNWQDAKYPDPLPGGYKGAESSVGHDCGTITPPEVLSTSYSEVEAAYTRSYVYRQCNEYAKLGLMGTTVIFSSGDDGVASYFCLTPDGSELSPDGTRMAPGWPMGCPYVTSVGATQIVPGKTIHDPESACMDVIYSGGGFSNYFARPAWQESAVATYLDKYPPPYTSEQYNTSSVRGFPDISANGYNYSLLVYGQWQAISGTSASAPVSAAMITAVNDARRALGKGPVGFINPAIYSPEFRGAFNDITNGTNPGCGTDGFTAGEGWDPVTGLGTPNFHVLLGLFSALP
ncbi:subtilisin-like protein [Amylocystis lapponica]|nr:subtilisin-like protein [Amylocystis lapponica]